MLKTWRCFLVDSRLCRGFLLFHTLGQQSRKKTQGEGKKMASKKEPVQLKARGVRGNSITSMEMALLLFFDTWPSNLRGILLFSVMEKPKTQASILPTLLLLLFPSPHTARSATSPPLLPPIGYHSNTHTEQLGTLKLMARYQGCCLDCRCTSQHPPAWPGIWWGCRRWGCALGASGHCKKTHMFSNTVGHSIHLSPFVLHCIKEP